MSNTNATEKSTKTIRREVRLKTDSVWDRLVKDAEVKLVTAVERVKKVEVALRIFRQNAEYGES
jgi:hypothetical protein